MVHRSLIIFCLLLQHVTVFCQQEISSEREALRAVATIRDKEDGKEKATQLLQLAKWYLAKPGRTDADLVQSLKYGKESLLLNDKLHNNLGMADSYFQLSKTDLEQHRYNEGRSDAENAIKLYAALGRQNELGESYVQLWTHHSLQGLSYPERIPYLEKAAAAFTAASNNLRLADCYREMGDLYQISGNLALSLTSLKKALELYQSVSYKRLQNIYDLLGTVYSMLGDSREGIRYGLLAIRTAHATGDSTLSLCTFYNRVGLAFMESNDIPNGYRNFENALPIALKHNDLESVISVVYNMADVQIKNNNPTAALALVNGIIRQYPKLSLHTEPLINCMLLSVYSQLKQYTKAREYSDALEKMSNSYNADFRTRAIIFKRLILFFIVTGEIEKAAHYASLHDQFSHTVNIPQVNANNSLYQFKVDSANGKYLNAIGHYQEYKHNLDAIFNEQKSLQINQLNILYETEKKDKDISLLTKEAQLQKSNLKQANTMKNIMLAGLGFVIILAALSYYGYYLKRKSNNILQAHQQEINQKNDSLQRLVTEKDWLVKEIHHRVKNNLHMVVGLLNSQTEYLKGEEALQAILESQQRVQAMSLIHQKLYQSENLSSIDMPSYILELVDYLQSSFDKKLPIRFNLDIATVEFPLSHSVPIGLILNEAITNAFKYAFPAGKEGIIHVRLHEEMDGQFILKVRDNGVGVPRGFDIKKSTTMGMMLIQGLSDDIHGDLRVFADQGTVIELAFYIPETVKSLSPNNYV